MVDLPLPEGPMMDITSPFAMSAHTSLSGGAKITAKPNYLRDHTVPQRAAVSINTESFAVGDRVNHNKFGEGTVLSASPIGNDTLIEISFDTVGTKKLMANFAKITKI